MVILDKSIITSGSGKYRVWVERHQVGSDLVYVLGGGEQPHVGGMVLCEPGKKPVVISRQGHYDAVVLEIVAEAACKKHQVVVVVVGGIHIDNASKNEIDMVIQNCRSLIPSL